MWHAPQKSGGCKSAHCLHVLLRDFWIMSAVSFVLCLNLPSRRDFAIYGLLFLLFSGIRTFIPPRVFLLLSCRKTLHFGKVVDPELGQ